jgi:hypothetical protein
MGGFVIEWIKETKRSVTDSNPKTFIRKIRKFK